MNKPLSLGLMAAALLLLAGGRANAQASAPAAEPIDPVAVTLTSTADVATTRAALIDETWGMSTLPTTLPTVTKTTNPFGSTLPDVGAVYDYHAAMSNGQVNDSNLYLNSSPNGRVVIMNMGHQGTNSWPSFNPTYGTVPVMDALLRHGFSIYAMNMPADGQCCSAHPELFSRYGNAAMQYFLEPAIQAMNYWGVHRTFSQDDFVGLSGGAWTGAVLQALDPRVTTAVLNAGSLPGTQFCCQSFPMSSLTNQADRSFAAEQSWRPFYSLAGYVDLYLMGASGPGREQLQILNIHDDCCFGPNQWNSIYMAANGGRNWYQQVSFYESLIDKAPIPSDFSVVLDPAAQAHQFSDPLAVDLTVNTLLSREVVTPEPPAVTPEPPTSTPKPPTATPEPRIATPQSPIAAPEPPTWAMLLPGLGFVGYLRMRRAATRQRRAVCA